jgi:hypothetical protein
MSLQEAERFRYNLEMLDLKIWWLIQIFSCFCLTGLIWVIQVVHYPSFVYVERSRFIEFERFHERRMTWIVGALMPAELISAGVLAWVDQSLLLWIGFALLVLIWGATAFLSVPCHRELESGFSERAWRRLVATNWLRTIGWSIRSLLLIDILLQQFLSRA